MAISKALPRKAMTNRERGLARRMEAPLAGKVRYGSGTPVVVTSARRPAGSRQARRMADLTKRSQRSRKIAIEQTDALLEQPVAAFGIAQLREQTCQLGAGFRTMIETQARLQIVARLAPQRIAQAEPPESQQQDGILRVILQPALGIGQLARRIAALHTPIAF